MDKSFVVAMKNTRQSITSPCDAVHTVDIWAALGATEIEVLMLVLKFAQRMAKQLLLCHARCGVQKSDHAAGTIAQLFGKDQELRI